jgi:hypothetical protein
MKILLAPSETKTQGGTLPFELSKLSFSSLTPLREKLLHDYTQEVTTSSTEALKVFLGLKKEKELQRYGKPLWNSPTKKAIERYTGVAFEKLDYPHLSPEAQRYLEENLILFSNLFGILRPQDPLPDYRLKQGKELKGQKVEQLYKEHLSALLDDYFEKEEILDLRAHYYQKFYIPSKNYTTLTFLKEGKVVSHWAKAYRGLVLRAIAQAHVTSIEALLALPIQGLQLQEIQERKKYREIIYTIHTPS